MTLFCVHSRRVVLGWAWFHSLYNRSKEEIVFDGFFFLYYYYTCGKVGVNRKRSDYVTIGDSIFGADTCCTCISTFHHFELDTTDLDVISTKDSTQISILIIVCRIRKHRVFPFCRKGSLGGKKGKNSCFTESRKKVSVPKMWRVAVKHGSVSKIEI